MRINKPRTVCDCLTVLLLRAVVVAAVVVIISTQLNDYKALVLCLCFGFALALCAGVKTQ